jgi:2-keto-4-pentenoate hydratase/2-oxohepta-3-ene-1,7-dioic acid hydratase in catechol pathway
VVAEPVFMPYLWGAVIGPGDDIVIPAEDTQPDYEVELSVVIGQTARGLTEETAMDAVFGFTVVNDVSAREVMVREKMQVMLSKSVDTFLPVGPHVVTQDEIPDLYGLEIAMAAGCASTPWKRTDPSWRQMRITPGYAAPDRSDTACRPGRVRAGRLLARGHPG